MKVLANLLIATIVTVGAVVAPAGAKAQATKPTLDGLAVVLAANHADPPAEALEVFRPGLYEKLAIIEADQKRPRISRIRALAAMAREDGDRTAPRVIALIDDPRAAPRLRLAAGWTLGNPLAHHPVAVPALGRLLSDPDAGLRERAVLSLARIGTVPALEVLEQHRIIERNVIVRTALREAAAKQRGVAPEALPREGVDRTPVLRTRTQPQVQVQSQQKGEVLR